MKLSPIDPISSSSLLFFHIDFTSKHLSQNTTSSTSTATQNPVVTPAAKDYIPTTVVVVIVAGLIAIIGNLIGKWREAEVGRIEADKRSEISDLNNEISNLNHKVEILEREKNFYQDLASDAPLEHLKKTKTNLEEIIDDLTSNVDSLKSELSNKDAENIRLEESLKQAIEKLTGNLSRLSALEKRASTARKSLNWIIQNKAILQEEAYQASIESLGYSNQYSEQDRNSFKNDIDDYLVIIIQSLRHGRFNLLDKAFKEIRFTVAPELYIEAFKFIKHKKLSSDTLNSDVKKELELYINYLINLFDSENH